VGSHIAILLLFSVMLAACGKQPHKTIKLKVKISEEEIQAIMSNQFFECGSVDGSPCPSGVARLFILDKEDAESSSVCTGFMVDNDTMVTNQHCVSSLAICRNTYVAIFDGSSYQENKCKTIIKTLNDGGPKERGKKIDVAIIKLEKSFKGKTFAISEKKVYSDDELSVWVIDHTGLADRNSNPYFSRITQFKCTAGSVSMNQSMILNNCPVIKGNSGSPVLNSSGSFIGVVWGSTAPKTINAATPLSERRRLSFQAAVTDVTFFKDYIPAKKLSLTEGI
jgi:V8-like Glu-specific endopeptidase